MTVGYVPEIQYLNLQDVNGFFFPDDSDLNLRFNDRGIKGHPLTVDGFAFMWGGVRATYGVTSGKVAYEVKVISNHSLHCMWISVCLMIALFTC